MKKSLNKSANHVEISVFRRNKTPQHILFEPEALLELKEDMMLAISTLLEGCRNIILSLSFKRWCEKRLCEYFMLFL